MEELLRICRDLDAQPPPLGDAHARDFFSSFSFEALFRLLGETVNGGGGGAGGGRTATPSDLRLVCDVVSRLLGTPLGHSMLAEAQPYLAAACTAPVPPLRRLAAEQYGRLLIPYTVRQQGSSGAAGADGTVRGPQAMDTETEEGGGGARESSQMEVDSGGGYGRSNTETACCLQLVRLLYDTDTAVAAAAADGLRAYGGGSLAALQQLVGPGSEVAAALAAAAADTSTAGALAAAAAATVRLRVAALALDLAVDGGADPERLQLLYDSGLLAPLQRQLSDRGDPLAALAALQLVEDHLATATATATVNGTAISNGNSNGAPAAAASGSGGSAAAVAALLLPQLLSLLSDPAVADAAMPVVAGIVRHSLPYALPPAAVAAALASGPHSATAAAAPPHPAALAGGPGLAAAPALLAAVRRVLDERGDASAAAEACGLDAAGSLGLSRAGAQLVLADAELTNAMCERALGRSPHPEVRCAALHALASCAGLERAGEEAERSAALLPAQAEETLRRGLFRACGAKRPSEVVAALMAQPFSDVRIAVYRFLSALLLRGWFAHEVVSGGSELLDRLTTPDSEGGASAATWRHAAACALWSTLRAAATAAAAGTTGADSTTGGGTANGATGGTAAAAAGLLPGEEAFVVALAAAEPRLRAAVQAGPYGSVGVAGGREAMYEQHFVATRGAGGGA